jgi:hypothetical protein
MIVASTPTGVSFGEPAGGGVGEGGGEVPEVGGRASSHHEYELRRSSWFRRGWCWRFWCGEAVVILLLCCAVLCACLVSGVAIVDLELRIA